MQENELKNEFVDEEITNIAQKLSAAKLERINSVDNTMIQIVNSLSKLDNIISSSDLNNSKSGSLLNLSKSIIGQGDQIIGRSRIKVETIENHQDDDDLIENENIQD